MHALAHMLMYVHRACACTHECMRVRQHTNCIATALHRTALHGSARLCTTPNDFQVETLEQGDRLVNLYDGFLTL